MIARAAAASSKRLVNPVSAAVLLLTSATATVVVADVHSPLRSVLVLVFVLVGPGLAVLGSCGLARGWLGAALVVATSASLATIIVLAQLYLRLWSPDTALGLLLIVALVAEAAKLPRLFLRQGAR